MIEGHQGDGKTHDATSKLERVDAARSNSSFMWEKLNKFMYNYIHCIWIKKLNQNKKTDILIKYSKFNPFCFHFTWTTTHTQLLLFEVICVSTPMILLFYTTIKEDSSKNVLPWNKKKTSIYFHFQFWLRFQTSPPCTLGPHQPLLEPQRPQPKVTKDWSNIITLRNHCNSQEWMLPNNIEPATNQNICITK